MLVRVEPWIRGEILYSLLARTARECSITDCRAALAVLVGSRNAIPSIDLPSRLDEVFSRVGAAAGFASTEAMVSEATLYPYMTCFLPKQRRDAIVGRARGGSGAGVEASIGMVAQGFGASGALRCCSECVVNLIKTEGDVSWLRLHQLPGVTTCAIHHRPLVAMTRQSALGNRHSLYQPGDALRPGSGAIEFQAHPMASRFAEFSRDLLNAASTGADCSRYSEVYRARLVEMGLGRGHQHIDWRRLRSQLQIGVAGWPGLEGGSRLGINSAEAPSWIRSALGGRRRAIHPICHLVLIEALFGSVSTFISALGGQLHLAHSQPTPSVNTEQDLEERARLAILGDATVSCRQAASRLGLSVTTVVLERRKLGIHVDTRRKSEPIEPGPVLDLIRTGTPVGEVARRCAMSLSAVYRLLSLHPLTRAARDEAILEQAHLRYRSAWREALGHTPEADLSAIRCRASNAYAWLRRHDRDWLNRHQPSPKIRQAKPRVDWFQRDRDLVAAASVAAKKIRQLERPLRATAGAILRQIYPVGSWQRFRSRLPGLSKVLEELAESPEQFKARKALLEASPRDDGPPTEALIPARRPT